MRFATCCVLVFVLTGCQYDRSFLNMNSNNGSPFLGLQLSVDAGETQTGSAEEPIQLVCSQPADSVLTLRTETARAQSSKWLTTSVPATSSRTGVFPNLLGMVEADENPLNAIGHRLAAF